LKKLYFLIIFFILIINNAYALLIPQEAFILNAKQIPNGLNIQFKIAKNHLLYKEKFEFFVDDASVRVGKPVFPLAKKKFDVNFDKEVEYYKNQVSIFLPLIEYKQPFTLKIMTQGCAEKGICYPPTAYYYNVKMMSKLDNGLLNSRLDKKRPFSFSPKNYKSAGLETADNANTSVEDIAPRAYLQKHPKEDSKKDYSKFYWLFIFMCIICTIIISHPSFNKDN